MNDPVIIASLIVLAKPAMLDSLEADILAIKGAEIHARDPEGRLIVVLDAPDDRTMADTISHVGTLPGVLHVNLAFNHSATAAAPRGASQEPLA